MSAREPHEKVSVTKAKRFFEKHVVPRRVRDFQAEQSYEQACGRKTILFRRTQPHEQERGEGETFPLSAVGVRTWAVFGKGVGLYFSQLLFLAAVCLCAAMVMMVAVHAYLQRETTSSRSNSQQGFLAMTAVCPAPLSVNATLGCPADTPTDTACVADYRPQCALPERAVHADIAMCVLLTLSLLLSQYFDARATRALDEAVQTVQDYALCVLDPPRDAAQADEWFAFFSRWGTVRYISVIRDNHDLLNCVLSVHRLRRKVREIERDLRWRFGETRIDDEEERNNNNNNNDSSITDKNNSGGESKINNNNNSNQRTTRKTKERTREYEREKAKTHKLLSHTRTVLQRERERLETLSRAKYAVSRVFVVFERESQQRLCLSALEISDARALLNAVDASRALAQQTLFRGTEVLDVREAPEPENVLWRNVRVSSFAEKFARNVFSALVSLAWLVMCYFLIQATKEVSPALLALTITFLDSAQTTVFHVLTSFTQPFSQSQFESAMQTRLFFARLLFSTVLPFSQTSWQRTIDAEILSQVMTVQATTCLLSPFIALFDPVGLVFRRVLGPLLSETQSELNTYWRGYSWSLAEKYTGLSKILFISLFHALLTPFSLFLGFLALALTFCVDHFLLLRKWRATVSLDAEVGERLRQQALLAITAHMYVSCRFIYSWPMDDASPVTVSDANSTLAQETVVWEQVSKYPSLSPFHWPHDERWQTLSQQRLLSRYKIAFFCVAALTLYVWIVLPLYHSLRAWFCYDLRTEGKAQEVPFSRLDGNLSVYEPVLASDHQEYLCAYTKEMRDEHRPPCLMRERERLRERRRLTERGSDDDDYDSEDNEDGTVDLSRYIPSEQQRHVLSVVKYYGEDLAEVGRAQSLSANVAAERDSERDDRLRMDTRKTATAAQREKDRERAKAKEREVSLATTSEGVIVRVAANTLAHARTQAEVPADLLAMITPKVVSLGTAEAMSDEEKSERETKAKHNKASFAKKTRQSQTRAGTDTDTERDRAREPAPSSRKEYNAKPLYKYLHGLSSSESERESDNNEESEVDLEEDFYVRRSRAAKTKAKRAAQQTSTENVNASVSAPATASVSREDLVKSVSFAAPKRSESPPRSNYRKKS